MTARKQTDDDTTVDAGDGTFSPDREGRARICFERLLPRPPWTIWRALTDPVERAVWFFPGTLEPRVGGVVALQDSGPGIIGRVTDVAAPGLLALRWSSIDAPDSSITFQVNPDGAGSIVHFTHHVDARCRPRNLLAGWHAIFDDLAVVIGAGEPTPTPGRHDRLRHLYRDAPVGGVAQ